MAYKHFYLAIIFRILLTIIFSGLSCYFLLKENYILGGFLIFSIVVLMINTIRYFNNINRWIAFFLLGIENEDTSLKIPKKTGSKAIDEIFNGMDRLNELFRQTKIEISTQEQYFRSIINQSATGLFSVNEKGRIMNTNPVAEKLTGIIQYYHINSLSKIDEALPGFIMNTDENKNLQSAIFENVKGQHLLFKLSTIVTQKETIRLVAVSDITKELDNREVDAWIKLARTLSHEIMNNIAPITTLSKVVGGYFTKEGNTVTKEHLEQKTIDNTVKALSVIEERSTGLMNFVENYRKFTKLPDPQLKQVALNELIEKNLLICSGFPNYDRVELRKNLLDDLTCMTDENLFSQVFINLIKNAVEAVNEDAKETSPLIQIKSFYDNNRILLEISNNGPTIPPEIKEQIFVPFYTTKEGGSGIGLSLSKQIMLKMGGDVILKTSHEWITFIIILG